MFISGSSREALSTLGPSKIKPYGQPIYVFFVFSVPWACQFDHKCS